MSDPRSFAFAKTSYRFVNRETRELANLVERSVGIDFDRGALLLFLIEANVCRFDFGTMQNVILQQNSFDGVISALLWLSGQPAMRHDEIRINLFHYIRLWDMFTSSLFILDYSREDLSRTASIFSTFSENIIMRGISEYESGKPLSYLTKILERMRAETVPMLRREEMYATKVHSSHVPKLPEYREPGFVSRAFAEELFFRALQ